VLATKKYKPVALKTRPIYGELPERFQIKREITGDPLEGMPGLSPNPTEFTPTGRYMAERKEIIDKIHAGDFLWLEERKLMHHFMMLQEIAFAWDDSERGSVRHDFFPPVEIPVIDHKVWVEWSIPIPRGQLEEFCRVIKNKIDAGVYEPSNSSYHSKFFGVIKKDGKSVRLVHALEPSNTVTIAHLGIPPAMEELANHFAGRACGAVLDLYSGYDHRDLDENSRDFTMFLTPFGALRLVKLPQGWTNSVPIFHDDVTFILRDEIPHVTIPYIDDVPVRGPGSRYVLPDGSQEVIPENPGIRCFVWEHFSNLNRVVQQLKYCGATSSGLKALLCMEIFPVVGHMCSFEGRRPSEDRIGVIDRWPPLENVSEVRQFLGAAGTMRMFIKDYTVMVRPLTTLLRASTDFE
jgi:hypothetical protein